jgi:hypothetical protein
MPSSMHWVLAVSSDTGVAEGDGAAALAGGVAALLVTVPVGVSVRVSVVVTPAGVTLVLVTAPGAPVGAAVVCVVA